MKKIFDEVSYSCSEKVTKTYSTSFSLATRLLSQNIRADSVKVSVHRQIIRQNRWVNKNIDSKKPLAIERKIIQRAIELNL